jgi:hypothetical protein
MQNWMRIAYYVYISSLCHIIRYTKISRITQMDVLIRHISQENLQYVLIRKHNEHTQSEIFSLEIHMKSDQFFIFLIIVPFLIYSDALIYYFEGT